MNFQHLFNHRRIIRLYSFGVILAILSLSTFAAELQVDAFKLQTGMPGLDPLQATSSALPADDAFNLSAFIELPNTVVLMWEIEEGYYLYKKSLKLLGADQNLIQSPQIPEGISISDEFFGEVEVYYDRLLVRIPFNSENAIQDIQLQLSYQGCAEIGYCYPMQQKNVVLELP